MPVQKKLPLRMCTGCGEMKDKRSMVRVVKTNDNEIILDLTGKKNGRGAYVCKNIECLKKAHKTHRFERSLKCQIPNEIYEKMENEISQ